VVSTPVPLVSPFKPDRNAPVRFDAGQDHRPLFTLKLQLLQVDLHQGFSA
jgi:hypothetical protein